jgi:hypothetical protein
MNIFKYWTSDPDPLQAIIGPINGFVAGSLIGPRIFGMF